MIKTEQVVQARKRYLRKGQSVQAQVCTDLLVSGLSRQLAKTYQVVRKCPGIPTKDVAHKLGLAQNHTGNLLAGLEAMGLIASGHIRGKPSYSIWWDDAYSFLGKEAAYTA